MPSLVEPGIPDYVDALVARATSRDRGQRPADATVLLHHLHRVEPALRDGPGLRRRAGRRPAAPARGRRRRRPDDLRRRHHPRALRRLRARAADRGRPARLGALRRRQPRPHDRPRASPRSSSGTVRTDGRPVAPSPSRCAPRCPHGAATTTLPAAPTSARPAPGRAPTRVVPVATTARRRSRKGPLLLLLVDAAGRRRRGRRVVVRLGALHHDPRRAGPRRGRRQRRAGGAPVSSAEVGEPAYSENVTAGLVIATDPETGRQGAATVAR